MSLSGLVSGIGSGAAAGAVGGLPGVIAGGFIGGALGAWGSRKTKQEKDREAAFGRQLGKWEEGGLGMSGAEYRTKLAAGKRVDTGAAKRAAMGGSGPWEGRKQAALMQQLEGAAEADSATRAQLNQLDAAKTATDVAQLRSMEQMIEAKSEQERAALMAAIGQLPKQAMSSAVLVNATSDGGGGITGDMFDDIYG